MTASIPLRMELRSIRLRLLPRCVVTMLLSGRFLLLISFMPAHPLSSLSLSLSPRYTPEQLFDVVADVDRYSEFLPWCLRSQVLWRRGGGEGEGSGRMEAELEIGFNVLREKYKSHITMKRPDFIQVGEGEREGVKGKSRKGRE